MDAEYTESSSVSDLGLHCLLVINVFIISRVCRKRVLTHFFKNVQETEKTSCFFQILYYLELLILILFPTQYVFMSLSFRINIIFYKRETCKLLSQNLFALKFCHFVCRKRVPTQLRLVITSLLVHGFASYLDRITLGTTPSI